MRIPRPRRPADPSPHEGHDAREMAEQDLAHTRAMTPIYKAMAAAFVEMRERNHLGEDIGHLYRGTKRS